MVYSVLLLCLPLSAQAADKNILSNELLSTQSLNVYSDVESLWALLQRMDKNLWDMHASERISKSDIDRLFSINCSAVGLHFDGARALREDAQASASDPGLDLEGGIRSGLDQSNGGNVTNSRQSAYIGLGWDVLNGGLRENKGKARWFDLRADRADLRAKMEYEDRLNQCRADRIPNAFLPQKAKLLKLKMELLRLLLSANRDGYLKGNRYLEDMLEVEQELQVASNDLSFIQPKLALFSRRNLLFPNMMPLINVNIQAVIEAIDLDKRGYQIANLDADIINQKRANEREARLRFYVHYEASGIGFQRHGPAAGVRFNVPIFEDKKAGADSYIARSEAAREESLVLRKRNAKHAFKKFTEERERVVRQWYRYLRADERLRRSMVAEKFNPLDVDNIAASERATTVIDAAIELERANELLYRRASEVLSYAQVLYIPSFVSVSAMVNEDYRGRLGGRALYVWSNVFNNHSNDFIRSFLKTKQVKTVLISASKRVDKDKLAAFLYQARREHLQIEPVFSDNDWLEPKHYDDAVRKIRYWTELDGQLDMYTIPKPVFKLGLQHLGGPEVLLDAPHDQPVLARHAIRSGLAKIHLDIEPQALTRFKGKNKKYAAAALLHLVEYLHQHLPNLKISLSVPVYWQANDYQQLAKLTDRLYLMSYGTHKASTIIRRLSVARQTVSATQIVVALRASDYRSELELDNVINRIRQQTGVGHFAVHAMRDYLKLTDQPAIPLKYADRILTVGKK